MPKRVAEFREGNEDASGHSVYHFIRDLIREGEDAKFVNKKGRYVLNWSSTLERYAIYKSKKNQHFKSKNINRRKASNGLRAALLNIYKKDGAKEYKESKKVNDKDEVIERQFQMPPKVFESLFGSKVELSDDSDHETSSTTSEVDEKPQVTPETPETSDTGFDEAMDISDDLLNMSANPSCSYVLGDMAADATVLENIKTENRVDPSADITPPCQIFDISAEELDSALDEIGSNPDSDVDLLGEVQDICPSSGSVKGGLQFHITLTEELPEDDTSGVAHFDGIGDVFLAKMNPYTFSGTIPAAQDPGPVFITVYTQAGRKLGMTCFMYVDEMREALKQLVKDPALQSLFFAMWSQEHGIMGSNSDIAMNLGPFILQDQDPSVQAKHTQSLKVLQLLVYTAAQEDAQQFIQMIFSISAGKIVFNSYKDRTPLPEDVARANGHDDLADYLQDVNERLSKENNDDVQSGIIDWLELVKAVDQIQKQSAIEDEHEIKRGQSKDDDNQSEYFADAETSSCGSFELDVGWSDSEDAEGVCTKDEELKKETSETSAFSLNSTLTTEACFEENTQFDNAQDKNKKPDSHEEPSVVTWKPFKSLNLLNSLLQWPSRRKDDLRARKQETCADQTQATGSFTQKVLQRVVRGGTQKTGDTGSREKERTESPSHKTTTRPKKRRQRGNWSFFRRAESFSQVRYILLTIALVTVLTGLKLGESPILHWAVGNGCTQISKLLVRCGLNVDARNFLMESPLHVAAKSGYIDLADVLTKLGGNVNAKSHQKHTPLHSAVWNGHLQIAATLMQHGADVQSGDVFGRTPTHLAAVTGRQRILEALIQHGGDVKGRDNFGRTPIHLAAAQGHEQILEILIQHGSDLKARDDSQKTALHLAAETGQLNSVDFLIQRGSDFKAGDLFGQTALHLAAQTGHRNVVEFLIQRGSCVNAVNVYRQTPLHLAAESGESGHKHIVELLIQHGSNVDAANIFGQTPLHLAARKGHEDVAEILVQERSNLEALDNSQKTATQCAEEGGHKKLVKLLVEHAKDVSTIKYFGKTPLHLAAENGRQQMLEILIQHGSDLNAQDEFQQTALHLAAQNGHRHIVKILMGGKIDVNTKNILGQTPLHLAAMRGHKKIAEVLLKGGGDIEARDLFQKTALHLAGQNGHRRVVEALIQQGSKVNVRNNVSQTPLHLTAFVGHKRMTEVLLQGGSDVDARDELQQTALHLAALKGHRRIVEALIKQGSNVSVRYNVGQTPLHLTAFVGHKRITEVLLQGGSDVNGRDYCQKTAPHLAAQNGHKQITEVFIQHGSTVKRRNLKNILIFKNHFIPSFIKHRNGATVSDTCYTGQISVSGVGREGEFRVDIIKTDSWQLNSSFLLVKNCGKIPASLSYQKCSYRSDAAVFHATQQVSHGCFAPTQRSKQAADRDASHIPKTLCESLQNWTKVREYLKHQRKQFRYLLPKIARRKTFFQSKQCASGGLSPPDLKQEMLCSSQYCSTWTSVRDGEGTCATPSFGFSCPVKVAIPSSDKSGHTGTACDCSNTNTKGKNISEVLPHSSTNHAIKISRASYQDRKSAALVAEVTVLVMMTLVTCLFLIYIVRKLPKWIEGTAKSRSLICKDRELLTLSSISLMQVSFKSPSLSRSSYDIAQIWITNERVDAGIQSKEPKLYLQQSQLNDAENFKT